VKLADMEQVQAFVKTGYAYAERTDAGSELIRELADGSCLQAYARRGVGRRGDGSPAACHPNRPTLRTCPPACILTCFRIFCLPAGDCFQRALGEVRKGAVRQLLEVPVWGLRRALASVDS
jgi:hypothetical protein